MTQHEDPYRILTAVGPGTPMGNLFRRFWLPALTSDELPAPDCTPVRIRILCEDLIAFRDSQGRVGIVDAYCPHRRAPLYFGRNEECGLRCVYHGWKFDVNGECVDIPNIVPPDNFIALKQKASIKSYAVQESGGLIWVYMGPKERQPALPGMEWVSLPDEQVKCSRWLHRSNWLQAAEGEIDTSHISFLHSRVNVTKNSPDWQRLAQDGAPQITVRETDYGFVYGSRRNYEGQYFWRVTQWMLPMWSAVPRSINDPILAGRAWVPIDDYTTTGFGYVYSPDHPLPPETFAEVAAGERFPPRSDKGTFRLPHGYVIDTYLPQANIENDFLIDRDLQRSTSFTGILGVNEQDRALQESMLSVAGHPGIVDRSAERLVKSDLPIMAARRMLMRLVKDLDQGVEPAAAANAGSYGVRGIAKLSPIADFDEFMQQHADYMTPLTTAAT
ncbi:Rieske 2Fe-2S domain-containing protein [Achromobacter aegrifaciens]|uniref:Rieske 2Fe-2S domain-containing protein n=1 Tax=Achromobacter aegrifaciens TaxID=1287736 RepID=UPI0027B9D4CD|nr:Rieske 2Fe-2S domain-containing protein [Achromobacter aegrifaciens]WLW61058.1 Rieske 2Fe-2S domain-containing protein [Achromobacter aegrifaciens]